MRSLFIFLGLLHLCGSTFVGVPECHSALLVDVDFPGSDIQVLSSPDAEHCQLLCTQYPSCQFFSFDGPDSSSDESSQFQCHLKSSESGEPDNQVSCSGITSGYSLRNCHPDPHPCLSRVYEDVNFPGADYDSFFTATYEECQRACTNDPFCDFFTFVEGDFSDEGVRYKCYLKFSWTIPTLPGVEANDHYISGFSHRILQHQQCHTECRPTLFPNLDLPGNDVESQPAASPEQCWTLCSAHSSCTYFSYVSYTFTCHLKAGAEVPVFSAATGVTSGMSSYFCKMDISWIKWVYHGIKFPGSTMRHFSVSCAHTCEKKCNMDPTCQFYSYNTNSHRCSLKRSIVLPAPPEVSELDDVVSGFSLRNCPCSDKLQCCKRR